MVSKKELIIKVAHKVLTQDGGSSFSMRKVAVESSMSLGNLQYYFKTKSDLIHGILEKYLVTYQTELKIYLDHCNKGQRGLEEFINNILIDIINDDDNFFIALFSFAELKGIDSSLKLFYEELYKILKEAIKIISDIKCITVKLNRATSLLLPYFEGFDSLSTYVKIDSEGIAKVLADTVWSLLGE
ncbi:MAG: TetR/AcrR family transcriptional regulator [Deltaproteobacteria bacterium]|nr:TetR/AcrR family transcriptional regulator [Deltaproteobacteria bacterium]